MGRIWLLCIGLYYMNTLVYGRVFTRCGLVHELVKQNFPRQDLRNWVCLIESESGRDTSALGGPNPDGSYDYGLFQINDHYWCSRKGPPGGTCHIQCKDLLTNDIAAASRCAKLIYRMQGFRAWYGWKKKCYGHSLPDISYCDLNPTENAEKIPSVTLV